MKKAGLPNPLAALLAGSLLSSAPARATEGLAAVQLTAGNELTPGYGQAQPSSAAYWLEPRADIDVVPVACAGLGRKVVTPYSCGPSRHLVTASMSTADRKPLGPLPALIFSSRWLQLPLYLGLIVAQGVYVFLFLKELWHLIHAAPTLTEQSIMLMVLGLIDVVMISNLLIMVIVGGYETFVSRLNLEGHPDEPEWLSHVNASVLKIKLAMAIIGISSIHLLRTFIEAGNLGGVGRTTNYTETGVMWQTIIHVVFILSAIGIAIVDRISNDAVDDGHKTHNRH